MINIRFHVVSIVAVFLALGIGVAMGASFIDRATVSSMQDRVDDLETGFRDRGGRIERFEDLLRSSDEAAAALTSPDSRATIGALTEVPVVLLAATGTPEGALSQLTEVLGNASADVVGSVEFQAGLPEAGSSVEDLSTALAALSASPPESPDPEPADPEPADPEPADPEPADPEPADPEPTVTPTDPLPDPSADAVATIERYSERGLIAVDSAGQPAETAFPTTAGVRYVMILAPGTSPDAEDWVVPFIEAYGEQSTSTMVVAGVSEPRPNGGLRVEPEGEETAGSTPLPELLEPVRTGAASNEVSSVQFATEPLARLSVVYTLQALTEGIVGHFGLGEGVDTPYPTAAQE